MRCLTLLLTTSLIASTSLAQFSIGLRGGYAHGAFGKDLGYFGYISYDQEVLSDTTLDFWEEEDNNYVIEGTNYGSAGKGIPITVELRYDFHEHVGVQLDVQGFYGSTQRIVDFSGQNQGHEEYWRRDISTIQVRVMPQLVLNSGFGLYSRFGAIIPVWGKSTLVDDKSSYLAIADEDFDTRMKMELKGKFSVGFVGSLGYEYIFGERIGLFAEAEMIALSIKRKEHEVVEFVSQGEDELELLRQAQPGTVNKTYGDDDPQSPYGSMGLNLGVRLHF